MAQSIAPPFLVWAWKNYHLRPGMDKHFDEWWEDVTDMAKDFYQVLGLKRDADEKAKHFWQQV